jgi:hypothetical protein
MASTVFVFDNDETTGFYIHLMTYLNFVIRCLDLTAEMELPKIQTVIDICRDAGIFRPGTEGFLRAVAERKRVGLIQAVVMYTNAYANPQMSWVSKSWGVVDWPNFLAKVLGHLAGDLSLFDVVLSRPPHLVQHVYPKKNFARILAALPASVPQDNIRMIFFDDKPTEIQGGSELLRTWHAPEYKCPLSIATIDAALARMLPPDTMFIAPSITYASIRHDIVSLSVSSYDAYIPPPVVPAGPWCGFDIDARLPLPPPPMPVLVTDLPVPPAPPSSPRVSPPTRRFVLEIHIHVHHHYDRRRRSRNHPYHRRHSYHPHSGR